MKAPKCVTSAIACLVGLSLAPFLHAATLTWNGGASGDWADGGTGWSGGNWNNANPDSAMFSGTPPGSVTINSGGVTVGNLTVSTGTYSFGGSGTLTLSNSTIDIANGLTTTVNATLAGTSGFTKTGGGTLELAGSNNLSGPTTVSNGRLKLIESTSRSYAGQISGSGIIIKSGSGTLTLSHPSNSIGRLQIDGGEVTVTGGLTSNGSGTFAIADYGNARLNINGGSVSVGGSREFVVGLQSTGVINLNGGTLSVASGMIIGIGSHAGTIYGNNGTGTLAISSGTASILGASSESIYLARPRTDNASTGNFTGNINITGGTLETARTFAEGPNTTGGTKTSTITLNGGTLKALGNNANWIDSSIDNLTFGSSGATIDTNGFDLTIAKGAGGSGGLTKNGSGTLTLTGPNIFTGTTRISAGKLELTGSGSIASSSNIVVGNSATLDVDAVSGGLWTVTAGQTLKGHQGTVLASSSSGQGLSFAADPDGAGPATGGIHAPGEGPGLQTLNGNVNYQTGSIFEWEMNYNAGNEGSRGVNYDALNMSGGITGGNAIFQIVLPGSTTFSDAFWNTSRSWARILTGVDGTSPVSNWSNVFSLAYFNLSGPNGTKQSISAPDTATRGGFTLTGNTLQWTAVPEPTGAFAGFLAAAGLLRRRRPTRLT